MGYIPLFLTLGGFVLLFLMVVNQSFVSKKKSLEKKLALVTEGLESIGQTPPPSVSLEREGIKALEKLYMETKATLTDEKRKTFEETIQRPFQYFKLERVQYNKLVEQKPYSFVAKLFGHTKIS